MTRKDCESRQSKTNPLRASLPSGKKATQALSARRAILLSLTLGSVMVGVARGESVRVWRTAVVTSDQVRLSDVCEFRGFDAATAELIKEHLLIDAPTAGGNRIVHSQLIRDALVEAGVNQATLTVSGSTECEISRPAKTTDDAPLDNKLQNSALAGGVGNRMLNEGPLSRGRGTERAERGARTLRQAVQDYFASELGRFGGEAEVSFDRANDGLLNLSGPEYEFRVRRQAGAALDLSAVDVDIITEVGVAQTVSVVVSVTLHRDVVVTRKAINQGATVRAGDVEVRRMSFRRTDRIGLDDATKCIGQRATKFIPAEAVIEPTMLESTPLVTRGQLVTLTSVCGSIRVVTSARAERDGMLGEVITVRSADNSKTEYDAMVVAAGKVQIGSESCEEPIRLSEGG